MTLKKEIIFILIIKVVLLYVIWHVWFDHNLTDDQVESNLKRVILNK